MQIQFVVAALADLNLASAIFVPIFKVFLAEAVFN